jgi:2-polyprenyl-6-methoxyphenol hydroxylase-like FAD-dependent oxidoreductase
MNTLPSQTDVVIVGAGPTGLVLGCVLAAEGIPFLLVDKLAEGANTSRAAVIHARTLEVLDALKVTECLHAHGHIVPRFSIRDRDHALASVQFGRLRTRYPYTLMIPQFLTESILLGRLRELGGDVFRPYAVKDVQQDCSAAWVTLSANGSGEKTIKARYVVGADGMHSSVRAHAGIAFTGDSYPQSFVLADVTMDWPIPADEVMLFFSPDGLVVVAPLPGNHFRIVATVDEAPEHPDINDVQRLLDSRGPKEALVKEIIWSSRFRVHHRVADRYRSGRIFVAGDAAHVHSPAGGQGMNTGIQDAVWLGRILAAVLNKQADKIKLDEYELIRRPVATRVVAFTDRMTKIATLRSRQSRALRNAFISLIGKTPLPRLLATELAGLRNR